MNVKYVFTLLSGVVECLFFSGLVFGWASLVFVLKEEGYFCLESEDGFTSDTVTTVVADLATSDNVSTTDADSIGNVTSFPNYQVTLEPAGSNSTVHDSPDCSVHQSVQLNTVFTVASMLTAFSTFPNGIIFDTFGTWVARSIALVLFTIGCILTAVSSAETAWILYPSMSCVAVGGILMLMTNLQIGNLFGKYRSSVITLMSGSLDSSSFVFLIFKTLHRGGISMSTLFEFTACCSVFLWLRTFLLLPRKNIPFPLQKGYDYGLTDCRGVGSNKDEELTVMNGHDNEEIKALNTTNSSHEAVHVATMQHCLTTTLFWGNAIHFSLLQLRNYFYLGMLYDYLHQLNDDEDTLSSYLTVFGTCQLFGFVCAPLNGFLIDGVSKVLHSKNVDPELIPLWAVSVSAVATTILGTIFSILVAIPDLPTQYGSFVLQVIFRSFLYGGCSSFIAAAFPVKHFGKLYGLTMCFAGCVLFIQFPLISLVLNVMKSDFTLINILFVLICLLTMIHPLNIWRLCRKKEASKKNTMFTKVEE